jgi:hypothetical protein
MLARVWQTAAPPSTGKDDPKARWAHRPLGYPSPPFWCGHLQSVSARPPGVGAQRQPVQGAAMPPTELPALPLRTLNAVQDLPYLLQDHNQVKLDQHVLRQAQHVPRDRSHGQVEGPLA